MLDLYYWTTPNGHKITIFLEEAGLAYDIKPVARDEAGAPARARLQLAPRGRRYCHIRARLRVEEYADRRHDEISSHARLARGNACEL